MSKKVEWTAEFPYKRGWYWVTREGFGIVEIARIFDDRLPVSGKWYVITFGGRIYSPEEFDGLLEERPLWCGPLVEPEVEMADGAIVVKPLSSEIRRAKPSE